MLKFLARFFVVVFYRLIFAFVVFIYSENAFSTCPFWCCTDSQIIGEFCHSTQSSTCPPGCYCPGTGGYATAFYGDVSGWCQGNEYGGSYSGANRCPKSYPNAEEGRYYIYDCYNGAGEYYPKKCSAGYYAYLDDVKQAQCATCGTDGAYYCPGGDYEMPHWGTTEKGRYICPAGHTCTDGKKATPCPAGYVKPSDGAGKCVECGEEEYASEGILCKTCPYGYWCTNPDKPHTKEPCPKGHYCVGSYAILCDVGTYSDGGAKLKKREGCDSEDENCAQICDMTDSSQNCTNLCNPKSAENCDDNPNYVIEEMFPVVACKACPAGTYGDTDEDGIPICTKCPPDTYNPNVGATSKFACQRCPSGSPEGSETCGGCTADEYLDPDDQKCKYCPAGSVVNETGDGCYVCPIGTYANNGECIECGETKWSNSGATRCEQCPYGQVAKYNWDSTGTVRESFKGCELVCPGGYIVEGTGNSKYCAKLCDGGYGWNNASLSCEKCADGTYRRGDDINNALCQPCAEGTYSFGPGKEQCTTCPPGSCCIESTTDTGVATAYQCNRGTYSAGELMCDNKEGKCTECPGGKTTVSKGAKSAEECVPTVAQYCLDPQRTLCFVWSKDINIYQNDIERQNIKFE